MKYFNKTLFLTILILSLSAGQSAIANEFPEEGARDDYSDHPHFKSSVPTRSEKMMPVQRVNCMMQHTLEDEEALEKELFPDLEN